MAARKRKSAPPKQAQAEPEFDADGETGARSPVASEVEAALGEIHAPDAAVGDGATELAADSEPEAPPEAEAEAEAEAEVEVPPDSEAGRVTLPPRSGVKDAEAEGPESEPAFEQGLLGEGP